MKNHSHYTVLLILTPLVMLFALALDFYIPIVPQLRQSFSVSHTTMQLTLSGFMFCCAISQILIGPLCDRFGRRAVALSSLLVFILGSIVSLFLYHFSILIIARLLQAFGASGTFLSAYTSVRDLYPKSSDSTKLYSLLNVSISQSPIFAPAIGGIIADTFDWPMVFITLLSIGIVIFICTYCFYTETATTTHPVHYQHLKTAYKTILTNHNFHIYSFSAAIGMGSFFMFFSQSPYIIIDLLHYSKFHYGILFGSVGACFFLASLCTNRICTHIGTHKTVELGALLISLGGLGLILYNIFFGLSIIGFILPMTAVVSGAAFTIGAGLSGTMQPFGKIAGIAFSAVGFYKFMLSALLGILLLQLEMAPYILGIIILSLSLPSLCLCIYFKEKLIENNKTPVILPTEYEL